MSKWFHSWFAWRFSLTRLVVAVVFLGAFVGLNVCGPRAPIGDAVLFFWGWPLPGGSTHLEGPDDFTPADFHEFHSLRWVPWTHYTYHLTKQRPVQWVRFGRRDLSGYGPINALVGLIPLFLILFLHPRRRTPPDEAPA